MITPFHNNILLRQIDISETKSYGNILVADIGQEKPNTAEVIAVGDGVWSVTGDHFIRCIAEVGDIVFIPSFGGIKLNYKEEEYIICKDTDILAKLIK
jgi:chaperonin GroES